VSSASRPGPILGVSTVVQHADGVLLVKRAKPPFRDVWAFPGGKVEFGEALKAAARREVLEETGLDVEIEEQIDRAEILQSHETAGVAAHHYVLIVFAGRYIGGEPTAGDDAEEARWLRAEELRSVETTPDTARILARLGFK
jgi:8-oxo-dGTP diphosphatase